LLGAGFDYTSPDGLYTLNLSSPFDLSIFHELIRISRSNPLCTFTNVKHDKSSLQFDVATDLEKLPTTGTLEVSERLTLPPE
tara:strand:+ start:377 stop:622 length:246 start_codon:yes stop_codon:yes gene_type:complete